MELPILTLSLAACLDQDAPCSCETETEKTSTSHSRFGSGSFKARRRGFPSEWCRSDLAEVFWKTFPSRDWGVYPGLYSAGEQRENPKSASVVALRPHSLDRYTGVLTPRSRCALFGLPFLASAAGNSRCYTQAEVHEGINWYEPEVDCHLSTQPPALPSFPLCGKNRACLQTGSFRMWA